MAEHEPTIRDDVDQRGEALDAELLPEEFPDDRPLVSRDYGTTEAEQGRREPLDRRLRRDEPDVMVSDDADRWSESDGSESGGEDDYESPDLLSQAEEDGTDLVREMTTLRSRRDRRADDWEQPRSPRSAEEDAIHLVDEDRPFEDD
ncbi:hypothetical protein BH23ACT9_BH23ACT9_07660 [soil metagenome]